jgi:cytochrome P450
MMNEVAADGPNLDHPFHIPEELVRDFDLYEGPGLNGGYSADIHKLWNAFQNSHPSIFWTPRNGGHWTLTRHDVIREVALNPAKFSSRDIFVPQGTSPHLIPTNSDAPLHSRYRRLMDPFFSPAALARVTDAARNVAIEMIERIKPNGSCEFMKEFAGIMPVVAFMSLINLPTDDLHYLLSVTAGVSPSNPDHKDAWADLSNYVGGQIDTRRTAPQDDFMSAMLKAEIDGRKLTEDEIFSMSLLVVAGGLDTVAISIGFAAAFLAQNPSHRRELIDHPERIDNAINELLRRFGVSNIARVAVEDVELRGVTIKAGESVMLMYPLAGIDETLHNDPLTVDFQRRNPASMIFGTGPHTCIGNRLAKREIRLFLEEWLKRIPDFSLAPGTEPKMACGITNTIAELHLVWDVG